jgi:uncharacterized protein
MTDPKLPELPKLIDFDWDQYNSTKVRLRHNITLEEAEQTFLNYHLVKFDRKHSKTEQRFQLLGASNSGRILFIVFTVRRNQVRVISARRASKKERNIYGKKT